MQPWQSAGEAIKKSAKRPFVNMAKAANLLSYAIPTNLVVQGLSKLNTKLGNFFESASRHGFSQEEALDSVRKKFEASKQKQEPQTIFQEIIADYPVESLDEEGQKQLSFIENVANQLEQKGKDITDPAFKKVKKRVSDLFKGKSGIMMQEMARSADMQQEIANQAEPMQPQQGQMVSGMGPGQKALMDILQRIQQRRGM